MSLQSWIIQMWCTPRNHSKRAYSSRTTTTVTTSVYLRRIKCCRGLVQDRSMDANQVNEMHLGHVMKNNEYLWRIKSTREICILLAFKEKSEHIVKGNTPNKGYPIQHIDINIYTGLINHVIVPNSRYWISKRQDKKHCQQCWFSLG